jgi:hypothetical protein
MNLRFLLVTVFALFSMSLMVEAGELGDSCRRGRSHRLIGNDASQPLARVPKKRTAAAPSLRLKSRRGNYPYVGKRTTPKRTYL